MLSTPFLSSPFTIRHTPPIGLAAASHLFPPPLCLLLLHVCFPPETIHARAYCRTGVDISGWGSFVYLYSTLFLAVLWGNGRVWNPDIPPPGDPSALRLVCPYTYIPPLATSAVLPRHEFRVSPSALASTRLGLPVVASQPTHSSNGSAAFV